MGFDISDCCVDSRDGHEDYEIVNSDALVVPVVAACIVQLATSSRGELILLSRRFTTKEPSIFGKWEFPGGRVRFGEKLEDAIRREIREELNLGITPRRVLHAQINTYESGVDYLVVFFECALIGSVEYFVDHLQWTRPQDVIEGKWDVLPGTVEAVKELLELERG